MSARLSQLLTLVLIAACGVFLLLVVLFQFGVGRGYRWWGIGDAASVAGGDLDRGSYKLPAWDAFNDVNTRPLFNEDRKPTPPPPPEAVASTEKPIPKLNLVLTGVIISPKVHIALVKENGKKESTSIKEGGSLPGDLSAWSLAQIKPRSVVFKSSAGEEVPLELIPVAIDQKPTPPPTPPPLPAQAAAAPGQPMAPGAVQPGTTLPAPADAPPAKPQDQVALDMQQRVEARRQQLREQNERAKAQQQQQQPQQQK